ncbi:MAG: T9SS type A sorting domain-containing protein [Bacteroidetes bacterium]|nr:T9SS type A sorting domain-containing protein [Bacteroidota bacterium]
MTFDLQNRMYIVGSFAINKDNSLKYIARWNGTAWEKLGNLTSNFAQEMFMAESDTKGNVYVSGYFGYTDGNSSQNFAAWINDPGIIESVKRLKTSTVPEKFTLEQNYPNPFNPATTIRYSVPSMQKIELKVYDLLGREVQTLVNELQSQGNYEVRFDASTLASGIYIYRLQSGSFVTTKKMMLIK